MELIGKVKGNGDATSKLESQLLCATGDADMGFTGGIVFVGDVGDTFDGCGGAL